MEMRYKHRMKDDVGYFYDEVEKELKSPMEERNVSLVDVACFDCGNCISEGDKIWGSRFRPLCQECSHNSEVFGFENEGHENVEGNIPTDMVLKCNHCGRFSMHLSKTNEAECNNQSCSLNAIAVPSDKR